MEEGGKHWHAPEGKRWGQYKRSMTVIKGTNQKSEGNEGVVLPRNLPEKGENVGYGGGMAEGGVLKGKKKGKKGTISKM